MQLPTVKKLKRRVHQLAAIAGIEPSDALRSLQVAGLRLASPFDQIPEKRLSEAAEALNIKLSQLYGLQSSKVDFESSSQEGKAEPYGNRNTLKEQGRHATEIATTPSQSSDRISRPNLKSIRVTLLSDEDIMNIHSALVEYFKNTDDPIVPPGSRDRNLLASASARPATSLGYVEKYPTLELKAAALFHSLSKNHAFHNGNKRTALVSMLYFLDSHGRRLDADVSDDEVFNMVVDVADSKFPEPNIHPDEVVVNIANWIQERTTATRARASSMRARDFVEKCKSAGLRVTDTSQGWKIAGPRGIVLLARNRDLPGNVVRIYLQNLGITEGETGITIDTFQDGISSAQAIMRRFQQVLKRLAHA